ncbi:MAG TPA: hypothetical protein VNT75_21665 [Symbiobacteriaceae bacterium]|nr:hypothetical protein [Symbiobacteriaceae bacterium]
MKRWMVAMLAVLLVGCASAPKPAPAPAPLSNDERYARYKQLEASTAGIPYVSMWDFDGRIDKLVIAVGTLEAKQAVQREMAKLGLPEESVVIEHPQLLLSEAAPFAGCQAAAPHRGDGGLAIPAVMQPGQEFDLKVTLPGEIMRGVDSYLECWDGKAWSARFMLHVGIGSPDAKPVARIAGANVVESLGLGGPGPERLVLPAVMPAGMYRIRKGVHVGTAQQTLTAEFEVGK